MSSLLEPDPRRAAIYGLSNKAEVVSKELIETTTLDAVVADHHLDFIDLVKLDTQGSELEILRGGTRTLEQVFGLRIEVEFAHLYRGQPLFGDVDTFLRSRGFEFIDFCKMRRRRWQIEPPGDTDLELGNRVGQLFTADAVYFRGPEEVTSRLEALTEEGRCRYLTGALVVCHVYGMTEYWFLLFTKNRDLLDPAAAASLAALFDELAPAPEHSA